MNPLKYVKQLIKSKKFRKTIIEEYQKYWKEQMDSFFFGDYAHLAKPIEPTLTLTFTQQ